MYSLKIQNERGELYELTHDRDEYTVLHISGLFPPHTTINTSSNGTEDGSRFSSAHLDPRNIVITVALEGDIEKNRQKLYRIFPLKSNVVVYYKNQNRDVKIYGFVESNEGDLFSKRETVQISLICTDPYFRSVADGKVFLASDANSLVANEGDVEVGFKATLKIQTEDEPQLVVNTETVEFSEMMKYQFDILALTNYRPTFNTLVVFKDYAKVDPSKYTCDNIIYQNNMHPFIKFNTPLSLGAKLKVDVYSVRDRIVTDLQTASGDTEAHEDDKSIYTQMIEVYAPNWFNFETDAYTLSLLSGRNGSVTRDVPVADIYKIETISSTESSTVYKIYLTGSYATGDYFRLTIPKTQEHYNTYVDEGTIYPDVYGEDNNYSFYVVSTPKSFSLSDDYTLYYKKYKIDESWIALDPSCIKQGYPTLSYRTLTFKILVNSGILNPYAGISSNYESVFRFTTINRDDYEYDTTSSTMVTLKEGYLSANISVTDWEPSSKDNFSAYLLSGKGGTIVNDITDISEFTPITAYGYPYVLNAKFPKGNMNVGDYIRIIAWHSDTYNSGDISGIPHGDFTAQTSELTVGYPRMAPAPIMTYHDTEQKKDRRTVYMNGEKLDSDIEIVAFEYEMHHYWMINTDTDITDDLTIEIVSGLTDIDVSGYTDSQVDEAMCCVDNLHLQNVTTGEYMRFSSVKFRNGDVIEISTVKDDLHVTVTESDWIEVGKSLVYDVLREGSFFQLARGLNFIRVSASTNADYISGEISSETLWGGV